MYERPPVLFVPANRSQYQAIYLFVDMLTLALELKTNFIAPQIMDSLLPLTQSTLDLIALPRFNGKDPELSRTGTQTY
jgi:hypothetical protein